MFMSLTGKYMAGCSLWIKLKDRQVSERGSLKVQRTLHFSAPESRNSLPPVSVLLLSDQFFSLIYPVCRRTFSCPPRPGRKLFPIKSVSVLFCTPLCQKTADWDMLLMTFLELEKSVNKIKLYCPWNLYSIESVMSKHLVQNLIKKLVCKSDVCDEIW